MGKVVVVLAVILIFVGVLVVGIHDAYSRGKVDQSQAKLQQMLQEQSFNDLLKNQVALADLLQFMESHRPWLLRPNTSFAQNQGCTKLAQNYTTALDQNQSHMADILFNLSTELHCE